MHAKINATGITAANLCEVIGPEGDLIVYEGSKSRCTSIQQNLEINSVPCEYRAENAIIGTEKTVAATDIDEADFIPVADLDNCDVLEMDCEGAGEKIIPDLEIRPRVIIVETHPPQVPTEKIRAMLEDKNYSVVEEYPDAKPGWIPPDGNVLVAVAQ